MNIKAIYTKLIKQVKRGENKDELKWYYNRPKKISRDVFFEQAVWAIWVAGKSRNATVEFMDRAKKKGFRNDFNWCGGLKKESLEKFMIKLHGKPVPEGARKRWEAIYNLAKKLKSYKSDSDFCKAFFNGKTKSADLDDNDVNRLTHMKLPYIGKANASLILRNIGGEFIKCDRWIETFLKYYKMRLPELENELKKENIPLGLFDIVLWAYCEEYVKETSNFKKHFDNKFRV